MSATSESRRAVSALALMLVPIAVWSLTHRYRGLVGDAELYAVQALSHLEPTLGNDIFLRNASQDRYTLFSPIYGFFIELLGLRNAGLVLLLGCKSVFFASAWAISRRLSDARVALLTLGFLIALHGEYGAFHVFQFGEDMLTARSMAEALAAAALCLHLYGRTGPAFVLAVAASLVHPLMALPMLLLLLCLCMPLKWSAAGAAAAVVGTLCVSWAAPLLPANSPLSVMDPTWLGMVRERSQFVFLQLWSADDWRLNARPFLSLCVALLALPDAGMRKLCIAALLVGVAGLLIAAIAGLIGPVPLLLQGQAWRWVWVTGLVGVLILGPVAASLSRADPIGPLCAVLMVAGWFVDGGYGTGCLLLASLVWLARKHLPARVAPHAPRAAAAVGLAILVSLAAHDWRAAHDWLAGHEALAPLDAREPRAMQRVHEIAGLDGVPVILTYALVRLIDSSRSVLAAAAIACALFAATALAMPGDLRAARSEGDGDRVAEFSDWRDAIPRGDNVFVAPSYYSAAFAWFTLERPSYLSVDQSSGIIFSRQTAMDVRHRSEVLRPVEDPDWRLLSARAQRAHGQSKLRLDPVTRERLMALCADPELNFVVAAEDVGFERMHHGHTGDAKDWNLYDCRRVNALKAPP
jgi:hypothetical protein